jgi:hypothetical protein
LNFRVLDPQSRVRYTQIGGHELTFCSQNFLEPA